MYESEGRKAKKGISFGPILIVLLGVVFLFNNFGLLPWEIWQNLWKFWPILLILFGIEVLLGRSSSLKTILILLALIFLIPIFLILNPLTGNPLATESLNFEKPLGNLTKTEVVMNLPSNKLHLDSLEANSDRVIFANIKYSKLFPAAEITEERSFGQAKYTFSQPQKYLPFSSNIGNTVDLKLSRLIPHSLFVKANTGVFDLVLDDLNLPLIEIDSGASQVNIRYAKNVSNKTFIKVAAARISLTIPADLQAEIKVDSAIESIKIDNTRYTKQENFYRTSNFSSATTKLKVEIVGSASTVEVK